MPLPYIRPSKIIRKVEEYDAGPENEVRPRITEEQVQAIDEHSKVLPKDTVKPNVSVVTHNLIYKIQIANSSKKIPLNSSKFEGV